MNICFFTKYEINWGSSRERIGNYLPLLKRHGYRYKILYLIPNKLSKMWIGQTDIPWIIKQIYSVFYSRVLGHIKYLRLVLTAKKFDLIIIQKVNLPVLFLKFLKKRNANIILDFDDLCFLTEEDKQKNLFKKFKLRWNFFQKPEVLRHYGRIIAGNTNLARLALKAAPNAKVAILPTPIDCSIYVPGPNKMASGKPITLGWIGSGENHLKHLGLLVNPLDTIGQNHPIRFVLVGSMYSSKIKKLFLSPHYELISIDWLSLPELVKTIQSFDIGLMPLKNDIHAQNKCGFKALAYMASGVATVVSPVGVNKEIIHDGTNGFWADDEQDWIQKISQLITDEKLRRQFSEAGRKSIEKNYSIRTMEHRFLDILERSTTQ